MSNNYVGVAPLTLVRCSNGRAQAVYAGGPIPGDALPEDIERFLDEGYIAQVDEPTGGMQIDVPGQVPDAETVTARGKSPAKAAAAKADAPPADPPPAS